MHSLKDSCMHINLKCSSLESVRPPDHNSQNSTAPNVHTATHFHRRLFTDAGVVICVDMLECLVTKFV